MAVETGVLYVVATPIGNLQDMSERAVATLQQVSRIAAEDTRHSRKLLAHYGITTPLLALHEHNEAALGKALLAQLHSGADLALISDAGTCIGSRAADHDLSVSLRSRIIAATNAVRPYRYLVNSLADIDNSQVLYNAMLRRTDLANADVFADARETIDLVVGSGGEAGSLIDRPVSPERGQIINTLFNNRVRETEYLTFNGADFSFAEVRQPNLAVMSFQHAKLRYADFSTTSVTNCSFGAAYLEGARFRRSSVTETSFSGVPGDELKPPRTPGSGGIEMWYTFLVGTDFNGALIKNSQFEDVHGQVMNFDAAIVHEVSFARSNITASTFRRAMIGTVNFEETWLGGVDFDGALVFSETFLDDIADAAIEGTFQRGIYELREATEEEILAHPRGGQQWQLGELGQEQAYIVVRTCDFDVGR